MSSCERFDIPTGLSISMIKLYQRWMETTQRRTCFAYEGEDADRSTCRTSKRSFEIRSVACATKVVCSADSGDGKNLRDELIVREASMDDHPETHEPTMVMPIGFATKNPLPKLTSAARKKFKNLLHVLHQLYFFSSNSAVRPRPEWCRLLLDPFPISIEGFSKVP